MWIASFIFLNERAAASVGHVDRMISQPALSSLRIWSIVASVSSVFVLVMDWTVTGWPPPMYVFPIRMALVCSR